MSGRSWELVTSNESTILAELLLDAMVMKNSASDRRLANPASTDESNRSEIFRVTDDLPDQLITSEAGPRWRWRRFPEYTRCKYKIMSRRVL